MLRSNNDQEDTCESHDKHYRLDFLAGGSSDLLAKLGPDNAFRFLAVRV